MDTRNNLLELMPKNGIVAEIGTWKGDFAERIIKTTNPKKLYLIDPYRYDQRYKNAWYGKSIGSQENMDKIYNEVVAKFKGRAKIIREASCFVIVEFKVNYFDWIYIDGNHTYDYAILDLNDSWDVLKPGGYLCGDDYGVKGWWKDGVTKAVDEFINGYRNLKVISLENNQFILQKCTN